MPEQEVPPPRVHLISCLYVVTGLVVIYLIGLRFYVPSSITYHAPPDVMLSVIPYAHLPGFWTLLVGVGCLAVSYWERFLFLKLITGLIGTTISCLALGGLFISNRKGISGNLDFAFGDRDNILARVSTDLSYYPLKYCIVFIFVIMLLRLFDYRPTTFRLTLLDVMLITLAVAVILGTRGVAMTVYGVA